MSHTLIIQKETDNLPAFKKWVERIAISFNTPVIVEYFYRGYATTCDRHKDTCFLSSYWHPIIETKGSKMLISVDRVNTWLTIDSQYLYNPESTLRARLTLELPDTTIIRSADRYGE